MLPAGNRYQSSVTFATPQRSPTLGSGKRRNLLDRPPELFDELEKSGTAADRGAVGASASRHVRHMRHCRRSLPSMVQRLCYNANLCYNQLRRNANSKAYSTVSH